MKMNPISPDGNSKIIYGSELVLIGFAALLLAAAVQPELKGHNPVPVKVNLPISAPAEVKLNTAAAQTSVKIHEINTQTTALLSDSQGPLPIALPHSEAEKLVN